MENIRNKLDAKGFLKDAGEWDRAVAHQIAREEGLEGLDVKRWEIIESLREYHQQYGMLPMLRKACKKMKENRRSCLSKSFKGDPVKVVKIAGLPQPVGEVLLHYRRTCCKRTGE